MFEVRGCLLMDRRGWADLHKEPDGNAHTDVQQMWGKRIRPGRSEGRGGDGRAQNEKICVCDADESVSCKPERVC